MNAQFYTDTVGPGSKDHLALTTAFACTMAWGGRLNQVLLYTTAAPVCSWKRATRVTCKSHLAIGTVQYELVVVVVHGPRQLRVVTGELSAVQVPSCACTVDHLQPFMTSDCIYFIYSH